MSSTQNTVIIHLFIYSNYISLLTGLEYKGLDIDSNNNFGQRKDIIFLSRYKQLYFQFCFYEE